MRVMTSDIPAACQGVNGVAHHSAVPSNVAVATPPMEPSHVLFGLTVGAILCVPRNLAPNILEHVARLDD